MKHAVRWLGALVALALGARGATAERPPLAHEMMGVANGCFVESVALLDHWHEAFGADAWARMLQWGAKEDEEVVAGHAVAVCEAHGKLWCWDINFGWKPLPVDVAQKENLEVVAKPVVAKYPGITARFPLYRVDFDQPPASAPPVAQPAAENESIRFASLVGERLARHRPVNVLRFTRPPGSGPAEGAAVVFVFNGRYCIYVPELGTTPFVHLRGSVENLRLAQFALNRLVPGLTNLKKL